MKLSGKPVSIAGLMIMAMDDFTAEQGMHNHSFQFPVQERSVMAVTDYVLSRQGPVVLRVENTDIC